MSKRPDQDLKILLISENELQITWKGITVKITIAAPINNNTFADEVIKTAIAKKRHFYKARKYIIVPVLIIFFILI